MWLALHAARYGAPDRMNTDPAHIQALLTDDRWLVGLARHLVSGHQAAEDAAQETRRIALQHAPRHQDEKGARAWLRVVLRRVVSRDRRTERRRTSRERQAAEPEAIESTLDVVERGAMQQAVVDAVMAMEEPYRSTVLHRFYDDLTAPEIATRMEVTPAAVRKRLSRGYEMLRTRLDEDWSDARETWQVAMGRWIAAHEDAPPPPVGWAERWWLLPLAGAMVLGAYAWAPWSADDEPLQLKLWQAYAPSPKDKEAHLGRVINGYGEPRFDASLEVGLPEAPLELYSGMRGELVVPPQFEISDVRSTDPDMRVRAIRVGFDREQSSTLYLIDRPAELRGRIVGSDGEPIAGARVTVHLSDEVFGLATGETWVGFDSRLAWTRTDADGEFELVGFPAVAGAVLEVLAAGHCSRRDTVELGGAVEVSLQRLPPPSR